MQTFLPYPDFEKSAACLDYRRLGKQRVEAYQILQVLSGVYTSWQCHPIVIMWQGYEDALIAYYAAMCREWIGRGYRQIKLPVLIPSERHVAPFWLGYGPFHASHRSNLLKKLPEHYGQFGWTESPDIPYLWI